MTTRKHYTASLPQEALKLFDIFNGLTGEEQSAVVDILYDALYERNLRLVLGGRIDESRRHHIDELEDTVKKLEQTIRDLEKRPRNLDVAYASIPKEERKELKKEIVKEYYYRDMVKNLKELRQENAKLKDKLRELGFIF